MGDWGPQMGDLIGGKWRVVRTMAIGAAFHQVYDVREKDTGAMAHCVIETVDPEPIKWLETYAKCLKSIEMWYLPKFIEFGHEIVIKIDRETEYDYLCTSPVGPQLSQLQRNLPPVAENRFSLYTALHVGFETLCALREFHTDGFLLRMWNLDYFCLNPSSPRTVVINHGGFWAPRPWRSFDGETAFPLRPPPVPFRGTMGFSSARAQRGNDQTRLDEMWAWFYVLVHVTSGLPFPPFPAELDIFQKLAWLADLKDALNEKPSELLRSSPPEYYDILEYLKSAPLEQEPDYDRLVQLLKKAIFRVVQENGGEEPKLDWEEGSLYYDHLRHLIEM